MPEPNGDETTPRSNGGPAPAAPMTPEQELRWRRTAIVILGTFLCLAFLMPVVTPRKTRWVRTGYYEPPRQETTGGIEFISLTLLSRKEVPAAVGAWFLYPLFAGVLLILLGWKAGSGLRATGLILLWLLGAAALFGVLSVTGLPDLGATASFHLVWFVLAGLLGYGIWTALMVGCRVRWYRPGSDAGYSWGVLGGLLYLLCLFIPILPRKSGLIAAAIPVRMLMNGRQAPVGVLLLLQMLGTAGCAILCILNTKRKPRDVARRLALMAFALWVGGGTFGAMVPIVMPGLAQSAELRAAIVSGSLKGAASGLGLMLLLPFGLIEDAIGRAGATDSGKRKSPQELLVEIRAKREAQEAASAETQPKETGQDPEAFQ